MEWEGMIERSRERLLGVIAMLVAILGLDDRAAPSTLPRYTHNYVLRILRPAESAIRRLIVIAAWKVVAPVLSARTRRPQPQPTLPDAGKTAQKTATENRTAEAPPAFPLFDPLKSFVFHRRPRRSTWIPRITALGVSSPRPIPEKRLPGPGDPIDAKALLRRLRAASHALNHLDAQARRLARWRARLDLSEPGPRRIVPLRPGYPPGRRKRPVHEIDVILSNLHSLALHAMAPDTS